MWIQHFTPLYTKKTLLQKGTLHKERRTVPGRLPVGLPGEVSTLSRAKTDDGSKSAAKGRVLAAAVAAQPLPDGPLDDVGPTGACAVAGFCSKLWPLRLGPSPSSSDSSSVVTCNCSTDTLLGQVNDHCCGAGRCWMPYTPCFIQIHPYVSIYPSVFLYIMRTSILKGQGAPSSSSVNPSRSGSSVRLSLHGAHKRQSEGRRVRVTTT